MVTPPLRTPYFKDISMERCRTNSSEFRGAGCKRSKRTLRTGRKETVLGLLILKPADTGQWNEDDYDVLEENGVVIGRVFQAVAPRNRLCRWASDHNGNIKRVAYGYELTREAAIAKSWRRK